MEHIQVIKAPKMRHRTYRARGWINPHMNKEVIIYAKSGDNGRLFGAITTKDISQEMEKQLNITIDKKKIVVNTIKTMGLYDVEVKLYPEISTKIKVIIKEQQ